MIVSIYSQEIRDKNIFSADERDTNAEQSEAKFGIYCWTEEIPTSPR